MRRATSHKPKTPATRRGPIRRAVPDLVIAGLLFLIAVSVGMDHLRTEGKRSPYLLKYYGPAVMIGLGHGFVNPQAGQAPAIKAFLALERDRIEPGDVPPDIPAAEIFVPPHNDPVALIVFTSASPRFDPEASVIGDAFRLVAVPTPSEARVLKSH
ncbi:MAG: hypothetical protein GWP08_03545 [Nitrospiraceae bacterium]|nr:hypothetical protein [Nitrospiraceae bacterium]